MAQSVKHATAARTVPSSSLGSSLQFGQYIGTRVSYKRLGNKEFEVCDTTLACARAFRKEINSQKENVEQY